MNEAISIKDLYFSYNSNIQILKNINLTINHNEVFGLLGPNGAGKTTLLECVQGVRNGYTGNIIVNGLDVRKDSDQIKPLIGVQFQSNSYFDYIRVDELFEFFAILYNMKITENEIKDLLNKVNMQEHKRSYVNKLSGGQKQRVSIALSILNKPQVLFLDEPTTGLDPNSRKDLWNIIKDIRKEGTTIILTTHYMEEVEALCDNVCFINNGSIYTVGKPEEIIENANLNSFIKIGLIADSDVQYLESCPTVETIKKEEDFFYLYTKDIRKTIDYINKLEDEKRITTTSINIQKANLEDVFLNMTGSVLKV
ncbi:ABC transporter ATP-binding protein [Lysinibacillus sp. G4S2]|uniref:ABC transporter ATP-binding protein n=1 Tax=Lysinibacillus sp. G4S2 TaxID=3055859 RepID=UPI0025A1CFA8|nr:ABC transporter ATP-binding protein [Lysinibacillus sp. G4S2]MDM5247065.1 ABC transporter ATP-binding protein [Lysinibacillus sp. G4S2]